MTPYNTARMHEELANYHRVFATAAETAEEQKHHTDLEKLLTGEAQRIWAALDGDDEPGFDGN